MGLDTSHDCWHGPYSAFRRWRNALAAAAGYPVNDIKDDDGFTYPTAQIGWESIHPKNYAGEWDQVPADPLVMLIAHSDCDGVIKSEHCSVLADRIEALIPLLPNDNESEYGTLMRAHAFMNGLRKAAAAGEDVDFH